MEKFEVHILGCGSALPTTRHFSSSQVVNIREKLFMIDCGEGAQLQLRRSKLKFTRLNHIFISHLHGDHCFGLMGLISTFGLVGRTATLHIHCHADLERILTPQLEYFCKGMAYNVEFHLINPTKAEVVYEDRSVTVSSIPLRHRIPTCGFLFAEKPTTNHIIDDMVGCRFFRKKESAGRNAMTQRDTADRYGTVFINDFGFCGVNQMEFHVVCHSFAEIFQLRREYPFEVGMAMYMQCSRAPHQSERRDKSHQSEAMVTVQMRYKYMVETRKLQFRAT